MKVRILEYKRFSPDRNDYVCKWKHTADEPAILAVVPLLRTSQEAASWRRSLTHRRTGIVETTWCAQRTREEKKNPILVSYFDREKPACVTLADSLYLLFNFFNEKQFYHSSSKYLILFVCLIMCPIQNNCMMVFFVSSTALQFCIH